MSVTTETRTHTIGDLVEITNPAPANAAYANRLALISTRPETVELSNGQTAVVYAVHLVKTTKTIIVFENEISPAPESDRYDEDKLEGDIIAKRSDDELVIFAVEVGDTGEVVIKTRQQD
jgi:hypothetical protein